MSRPVLVLNAGSSSLKYQLRQPDSPDPIAVGLIERIGGSGARAVHHGGAGAEFSGDIADTAAALDVMQRLFSQAGQPLSADGLRAVGHRVVHGGPVFDAPVRVTDEVLQQIRELSELAPLHNPANVTGIEQAERAFPGVPQVAVFDTAFFAGLPAVAATYALDRTVAAKFRIRRYGFHGTSHHYVSGRAAEFLHRNPSGLNQIVLHLGNGASVSAQRGGRPVETSMGLTPLEGLVMGTRSGDIDPGVLTYLMRVGGYDADGLDDLLNRRSGLLGLAGASDFRDLLARIEKGDGNADLAVDIYAHRIRKYIGAYLAVLGGTDTVVFTAGVGENVPLVRARALAGLDRLGIQLDPARNQARSDGPRVISPDGAPVTVLVVPTDEELAIARAAAELLDADA